jgi:hypothetical protein
MMQRDRLKVQQALIRKGFEQDDTHHHYFVYRTEEGLLTPIRTRTSHSGKTLDDYLLGAMAKQCRLDRGQFLELVDCPLSRTDYESAVNEYF